MFGLFSMLTKRIGYPEGHGDDLPAAQEVSHLKAKIDAGADFVITQLFYNVKLYLTWLSECRSQGEEIKCFALRSSLMPPFQASLCL